MPLHRTALVSRHQLHHPDEKPPAPPDPLNYERVLKYNPNHDPKTGKFTSGGGGRRGGTAGPPTEDAFGAHLKQRGRTPYDSSGRVIKPKNIEEARAMAKNVIRGYQGVATRASLRGGTIDAGFERGAPPVRDPHFERGRGANVDPNFNRGEGDAEMAGSTPYAHTSGLRPGALTVPKQFAISPADKAKNYKEMFGKHPGSMKGGKPTKRSTFS